MNKILFAIICLFSFSVAALDLPPDKLNIQNGQTDEFAVPSLNIAEHLQPSVGIYYLYTNLPSQIIYKDSGKQVTPVVLDSHMLSLNSSIGLFGFLEAGVGVPVLLHQNVEGLGYLGGKTNTLSMNGLGDISLSLKSKFVTVKKVLSFGASLYGTVPTGGMYANAGPTIMPMALATLREDNVYSLTYGVGYRFMKDQGFKFNNQNVSVDGEVVGNMGASVFLWPKYIDLFGNLIISATINGTEHQVPMELLGGLRGHLPYNFNVLVGGGGGLDNDVGAPRYRVFAGFSWSPKFKCKKCDQPSEPQVVEKEVIKEVFIVEKEIYLPPLYFDHDKDTVMAQSVPMLYRTLKVLKDNPQVTSIVIEAHADIDGNDKYNVALSERRAQTVYNFLTINGIDPNRLKTISFGEASPYDVGKNKDAKSRNRRVEFKFSSKFGDGK